MILRQGLSLAQRIAVMASHAPYGSLPFNPTQPQIHSPQTYPMTPMHYQQHPLFTLFTGLPLRYYTMLGRLKKLLKSSNTDPAYDLSKLGLNETHNPLRLEAILQLYKELPEEKKVKLIDELLLRITSKSWVLQLKSYIIIHALITKFFPPYLEQKLLMAKFKDYEETKSEDIKHWIRTNMTKQYHTYLVKLYINYELYNSCCKKDSQSLMQTSFVQQINKSFKVLNMVVGIMQNQTNFSKMGRYYPEYLVIFELYLMYLKDVRLYYGRIKHSMNYILDSYNYLNDQEITHGFHFINEALVTSDRQYEFFYNRYFYQKMKSFDYPTFYKLDYQKYNKLVKNIQKRGLRLESSFKIRNRQKQRNNHNKTLDGSELTAVTVQGHSKTLGSLSFNYRYEECLPSNEFDI